MATLHGGDSPVVYLKGSVEALLERCSTLLGADGESNPLDRDAVHAQVEAMASEGLRVLAFARLAVPPDTTPSIMTMFPMDWSFSVCRA